LLPPLCGGSRRAIALRRDTSPRCVEHRPTRSRCRGLLPRRGCYLGRGLLLGQGRVRGPLDRLPRCGAGTRRRGIA
jgi:hypothetical protein